MNKNNLLEYLEKRGIVFDDYKNFCRNGSWSSYTFVSCVLNNLEFTVNCFFDNSNELGLGLVLSNDILSTNDKDFIAIGAIQGDDIICMDIQTGKIKLWMIENGEGEFVKVADTFASFLEAVTDKNNVR